MHFASISMKLPVSDLIELIGTATNQDPAFILPYRMLRNGSSVARLVEKEVKEGTVADVLNLRNYSEHDPSDAEERWD